MSESYIFPIRICATCGQRTSVGRECYGPRHESCLRDMKGRLLVLDEGAAASGPRRPTPRVLARVRRLREGPPEATV